MFKSLNHHAKIVIDSMNLPTPASPSTTLDSPSSYDSSEISIQSPEGTSKTSAHFTFEISVIPCLYIGVTKCRCPTTRRESLALLEKNPPREALWDAKQHAMVGKRVIEIEERELDPETGMPIPENRLLIAIISGQMDENGGFWATYASVGWVMRGCDPQDPKRHRGDRVPVRSDSEWDEWLVM